MYPEHGTEVDTLLKHADTAMYEVKKWQNGFQFYTTQLDSELYERIELEGYLRKALERNELLLYYQPQIRTADSRMIGVEALIRWKHPHKGCCHQMCSFPSQRKRESFMTLGTGRCGKLAGR